MAPATLSREPHLLDRPVWNALASRQAPLAIGGVLARRFHPDFGPFGDVVDDSPEAGAALAALVPPGGRVVLLRADRCPVPAGMGVELSAAALQMVAMRVRPPTRSVPLAPLDDADAPQMRALAELTEPGPFAVRTHELGTFFGVRLEGRLVAMAGERMRPDGFTEVSGVCTHPDYRGRGYAGALMSAVMAGIVARGETPFLHVYSANTGAIALYEALGFVRRCEMTLTVLVRTQDAR